MAVDPKDREAYEIGKATNDMDPVSRFIRDRAWDWQPESEKAAYDKGRNDERLDEDKSDDSSSSGCFLTTACVQAVGLPDDCMELETLRAFRDEILLSSDGGRAEVSEYYAKAPAIVRLINARPDANDVLCCIYEGMVVPCVVLIRSGRCDAAHRLYRKWFSALAKSA